MWGLTLLIIVFFLFGTIAYYTIDSMIPFCFGAVGFSCLFMGVFSKLGLFHLEAVFTTEFPIWYPLVWFFIPFLLYAAVVLPTSKKVYRRIHNKERMF